MQLMERTPRYAYVPEERTFHSPTSLHHSQFVGSPYPPEMQPSQSSPHAAISSSQLEPSLCSSGMCKVAPSKSPLFRMYARTSSYEALVTFRAGTLGVSFVWPSMDGLPIWDASGVAECSALLPFSRQVLTAGTSA